MKHVSRWEKAARKMVEVKRTPWASLLPWQITFPAATHDLKDYAYFPTRTEARRAANRRIEALTQILQQASKLAGF